MISSESAASFCNDAYRFKKDSRHAEGSVGGSPLFDVPLLLRTAHTLELEVAVMGLRTDSLALENDESNRSDDLKIVSNVTHKRMASLA